MVCPPFGRRLLRVRLSGAAAGSVAVTIYRSHKSLSETMISARGLKTRGRKTKNKQSNKKLDEQGAEDAASSPKRGRDRLLLSSQEKLRSVLPKLV